VLGLSTAFRKGLSARGLTRAVGIPKHQKVYSDDVALIFPVAGHRRPRKHSIPDTLSMVASLAGHASRRRHLSHIEPYRPVHGGAYSVHVLICI
jgi:hypothetical protein